MTEAPYQKPTRWTVLAGAVILGLVGACSQTSPADTSLTTVPAPDISTTAPADTTVTTAPANTSSSPVGAEPRCPVISFDTTAPRLDAETSLDSDTVSAGATFSGTVTFTNPGEETVYFPNDGSIQALLYTQGTDTIVAVYTEPIPSPLHGLEVPPGGSAELGLVGGTTPCGPSAPDTLPAGTYDVRFPLVTELSNPVPIDVTE